MYRKLTVLGVMLTVLASLAAPASAAGHVRKYTPSRTATVHSALAGTSKHHVTKLTKVKKMKKKHHKKK